MRTTTKVSCLAIGLLGAWYAQAQTDPPAEEASAPEAAPGEPADPAEPAAADPKAADAIAEAEAGGSPVEEPGKAYHFVGLRYRGVIIPKFMVNLFGDGGSSVYVHGFGPEFTVRKDAFEYVFSLWYAAYSMDPTPFKASSDPEVAWEIVESKLKVLYLTTDFNWSSELSPEFSINYGMGAGFGFVFGDLIREQAHPAGSTDPYQYQRCTAPGVPDPTYCGTDNNHYDGYKEPSWANGGSKPIIFPWLVVQTGVRYKPHRNFALRLDGGFGTSGFFFGLAGNYGL